MRKQLLVTVAVVMCAALGGAVHADSAASGPMSPAVATPVDTAPFWLHPPTPMTFSCNQIPNLPAPTSLICGTTSSPASCIGKVIYDAVCGVSSGYCLYCWQGSGPPDSNGNYPCDCRN